MRDVTIAIKINKINETNTLTFSALQCLKEGLTF